MTTDEAKGRLDRASGNYGVESLEKVHFDSREEWIKAWSKPDREFIMPDGMFLFYKSKEVWANEEYWAYLDKKCEVGTHTSFLGYPLWYLSIRRRDEKPLHDWRILQGIKNLVVGEEFEAIELYPADSRIMDIGNVYHLWILAPKKGETEPPRFPLGAKNPELGGAVVKKALLICTERTKRAYDSGEMPPEEKKTFREYATRVQMVIFPDAKLPEAEAMFPGEEKLVAMTKYTNKHPELEMEEWIPS
jgi:hypothetical protein